MFPIENLVVRILDVVGNVQPRAACAKPIPNSLSAAGPVSAPEVPAEPSAALQTAGGSLRGPRKANAGRGTDHR